jgi:hypothetical protein
LTVRGAGSNRERHGSEKIMSDSSKWIVTLSNAEAFAPLHDKVRAAGFKAEQALEEIGVITGTADEAVVEKLRQIHGVVDVSPDLPVSIG